MAKQFLWAYYMMLSDHMWDDEQTEPNSWYPDDTYHDEISFDMATWDETVAFLRERQFNTLLIDVGDGLKLESHPEICAPNAWSKETLDRKLREAREAGLTPVPKLNFSACHHTWLKEYRRQLGTEQYYRVCGDVIDEVSELFGKPELFHLGLDEENYVIQKRNALCVIRGEKLWWHDAYFLFDRCEKNGARPWVWSDYYLDHPDLFVKNMPKSVLQSMWYYGRFFDGWENEWGSGAIEAYRRFGELGYDDVPTCSTWGNNDNTHETLAHCKKVVAPEHLAGFMTAAWCKTLPDEIYMLKNDAHRFWMARKAFYPETLR